MEQSQPDGTPSSDDVARERLSPRGIVRNVLSLGSSSSATGASFFVLSIVVTRELGVAALGTFSVATAIALLANRVAELGIHQIVVRDISREPAAERAILDAGIRSRLLTALVAVAVAGVALLAVEADIQLVSVTASVTGFVLLHGFARVALAFAHAEFRMVKETVVVVPAALAIIGAGTWVMVLGRPIEYVGLVYFVGGVVELAVAWLVRTARQAQSAMADRPKRTIRSILSESWPIGLAGLAAFLYYRVDTLMLSRLTDAPTTGEYNLAFNILYIPNLTFWSIAAVAFPLLARYSDREQNNDVLALYRKLLAAGLILGFFVVLLIPADDWVLRAVYGESGGSGERVLPWLLVSQPFSFTVAAAGTTMNATGRQKLALLVGGSGLVVNVVLNLLMIPGLAATGAAVATLLTESAAALLGVGLLHRRGLSPLGARRARDS